MGQLVLLAVLERGSGTLLQLLPRPLLTLAASACKLIRIISRFVFCPVVAEVYLVLILFN